MIKKEFQKMFSKISNEPFDLLIILNDPQFILDNS